MNRLQEIIDHKRLEVEQRRELIPVKLLEKSIYYQTPPVSLRKYLTRPDKVGIIAEIKRCSPSKGAINENLSVEDLSVGYMEAGASALSVLTDQKYFGGSNDDLTLARRFNYCPVLRKDFIVDDYQVIEAKSIGADAILLIAAVLKPVEIEKLSVFAHELGLEVLLEVHSESELERSVCSSVDIIGINNRDLKSFTVDVDTSFELVEKVPKEFLKISESGIDSAELVNKLRGVGFSGFLIGEAFLNSARPARECAKFVQALNLLEAQCVSEG